MNNWKCKYFILLNLSVILLTNSIANSQSLSETFELDYNWRGFDDRKGLARSQIFDIHQFDNGILWIAGDRFLIEYNGSKFRKFGLEDGFLDPTIFQLHRDYWNRVWCVGMSGMLCYKEDNQMIPYAWNDTIARYLGETIITGFHVAQDTSVIVGTLRKGIFQIDKDGSTHWYGKGVRGFKVVIGDDFIVQGALTGNGAAGTMLYHYGQYEAYSPLKTPVPVTGTLRGDFSGGMYVLGGNRNLFVVREDSVYQHIRTSGTVISVNIIGDKLWVGLYRNGLEVYTMDSDQYKLSGHHLKNASVSNVIEDSHGGIWASTLVSGLYYSASQRIMKLIPPKEYPIEQYTAMKRCDSSIFVGITDGRIARFSTNRNFEVVVDHRGMSVSDIAKVPDKQEVYVDGRYISKLDCGGNWISDFSKNLYVRNAVCLYADSNDLLWIGNHRGVYQFQNGRLKSRSDSLNDATRISAIGKVGGEIMIATNSGPHSMVDGRIVENWLTESVQGIISEFENYREGTIIATHNAGVFFVNKDREVLHFSGAALPCGIIHNLIVVGDHFLCMTDVGLIWCCINNANLEYALIDQSNGLIAKEVFDAEVLNGMIYVSSARGISVVPEEVFRNIPRSPVPITSLTEIKVDGVATSDDVIVLAPGKHDILIGYQGIYFPDQSNVNFRYRLVGLDTSWNYTINTSALYKQLPGGEYQFEIQARIGKGDWSLVDSQTTLSVNIGLHFWQHRWFWIMVIGLTGLGIYALLITGAVRIDKEVFINYYIQLIRKITPKNRRTDIVTVKSVLDGSNVIIPVSDIVWIKAARNYIEIKTQKGTVTVRDNIGKIEKRLMAYPDLMRLHRSIIVNWAMVEQVHSDHVVLEGVIIKVGRKYIDDFKEKKARLFH